MKNIARLVFLVLFLMGLTSISTNAQTAHMQNGFSLKKPISESTFDANPADSARSHFAIKINPLQWLWDDIRLLVEVPINKNNSLQFRIGYRNSAINPYDKKYCYEKEEYWDNLTNQYITYQYKAIGYNIGIGFNHFFKNNFYIAPSLLYKCYEFSFSPPEHWWFTEHFGEDHGIDYRDNFTKKIYAIELRGGKVLHYRRLLFDLYAGCGFRWRGVNVSDIYNYEILPWYYTTYNFPNSKTEEAATIHAGINIGFCL